MKRGASFRFQPVLTFEKLCIRKQKHSSDLSGIYMLLLIRVLCLSLLLIAVLCFTGFAQAQDFTVIVLPDTQNEAEFNPNILNSQMQWIVASRSTLNISAVLGEGDIVNDGAEIAQMQNADAAYKLLDQAGIPYFAAIGNHDYDGFDPKSGRTVNGFNQWFGPARYAGKSWYRGNLNGSNENFYGIVTIGSKQYLILALEYMPRPAALEWGESILAANPGMEAIIVTHSYMFVDNTRVDRCDQQDMPPGNANGDDMWAVFRKHANVVMVLSGHHIEGQVARRSDVADNGNLVHQIFTNYQTSPNGGDGWLRIITFHPSSNTISVQTYSPFLNQFKTDSTNQFTLAYHNPYPSGQGTLSGKVRSTGCSSLAGITVTAGGVSTVTGWDGSYSMQINPGSYTVTASGPGWQTSALTETVSGGFDTDLDFYLTSGDSASPTSATSPPRGGAGLQPGVPGTRAPALPGVGKVGWR